jgi:flagellar basal-body rod protein FlgG
MDAKPLSNMNTGFVDTYSALDARMKIVDVIANNLANANTAGFKRDFTHILQNAVGFEAGTQIDISPGDIMPTGNNLDVALNGPGFFAIETPNGTRYTRAGNFALSQSGELVTKEGFKVMSTSNSPIKIGEGTVEIHDGGVVTVDGNEVGALKVVTFNDVTKLQKEGNSRFVWNGSPGGVQTVSDPDVKGGYLERSNVSAIDEMVHLMTSYREFESVQRALRTLMSDMNSKLVQELGKLG